MRVKVPEDVLVKVYELRDPRDEECKPRYIGITIKDLNSRLSGHLTNYSLKTKTHKNNWIRDLLKEDVKPTIHLIEEVIGWSYACEVEKYYIKEFKDQGYNLTNVTDGGEGSVGIIVREDTRAKLSKNSSGSNNPMFGKSGELSPCWGRKQSREEIENRIKSSRNTFLKKELVEGAGVYFVNRSKRWCSCIRINGKKYSLGSYGNRGDAEKVYKEAYLIRSSNCLDFDSRITELIKKYTDIEWCRKLKNKSPQVNFKPQYKRWIVRISVLSNRRHIGMYPTKEDAENAYIDEANKVITNILLTYKFNMENIEKEFLIRREL